MNIDKYKRLSEHSETGYLWTVTEPDGSCWEYEYVEEALWAIYFGWCGCGNPGEVLLYIGDVLRRVDSEGADISYEDPPTMFALYVLDDKGLIEHGTTIRCSWLTEKGRELLGDIEELRVMQKVEGGE